jgi:hypothetical protein
VFPDLFFVVHFYKTWLNFILFNIGNYILKGIGNSDGSDFSFIVYLNNKQEAAKCNLLNNTNCKVKSFLGKKLSINVTSF